MAQKKKLPEPVQKNSKPAQKAKNPSVFKIGNIFPVTTCLLYFAVPFIPDMGAYDNFGPQWLYIVILDIVVTSFILARKNDYHLATSKLFNNLFSRLYLGFFVLAGVSIFFAINPIEGLVCYVRLIATIIAFFNISILLYGRTDLLKIIAQILGLILLLESAQTISSFISNLGKLNNYDIIMGLKGTAGNKNIFAAGLIVKVPFVIYSLYTSRLWGKILNILTFTLATLSIFIINSRATYVSLVLISLMYFAFCFVTYVKDRKLEETLYRTSYVLMPLLIAFLSAQLLLSNISNPLDQTDIKYFGTVTERFTSATQTEDASNTVRFRLWNHAIDYTKHHPLMGCGYGNWKIASIPYQRIITNDLFVPVHAHNDFLEAFAELGLPGGLLFLSLFVCILVFTFKTFFSEADEGTKLMSVFSLLAFAGYAVDAFFNFPIERPLSQMFFAFITSLNVIAFIKGWEEQKKEKVNPQKSNILKPLFGFIALLLLIPSLYVTYQTYQSLIVQRSVLQDLNNEPLKLDWKEIMRSFPPIPNLSATAQPIDAIKGRYLYEAGKFDEAMVLLDKGRKANPVIGYSEFLKAGVYFKQGKYDSAARNATVAFYTRPKARTYYQTLIAVLAKQRDTLNIEKAFNEAARYRNEEYVWDLYLRGMLNSQGKGSQKLLNMVDSGLHLFAGDSMLLARRNEIVSLMNVPVQNNTKVVDYTLAQKYYAAGVAAFGTGVPGKDDLEKAASSFLKSAAINPGNYSSLENAAICYFNMKNWQKAIVYFDKELSLKVSVDGKPEYFKGAALINLGKKDEGCSVLQIAKLKGWKDADAIIKSNCK